MARPVRALERGLEILAFLNRHNGSNSNQVAIGTGMSRGTAYRMLETMLGIGVLARDLDHGRYWLTQNVHQLSDGYSEESWITAIATPVMEALGQRIGWPVMLSTPLRTEMVLRATTDYRTTLVFKRHPLGHRLPMLGSATGLAYLAFTTPTMRRITVDLLAGGPPSPFQILANDRPRLGRMLSRVRRRGFAVSPSQEGGSTSIAAPLLVGERLVGCLATRYFTRAMPEAAAIEALVAPLIEAASQICTSAQAST